ncbi:MAG: hypothetical protein A2033_14360 [Bacteroidetes bacterium GWA2_31_9]|nr:MAG: hypothetical protein A2033_14360 [Bacteroidetes bacterium GWA2_31_9]
MKNIKIFYLLCALFILFYKINIAQNVVIDSLLKEFKKVKHDTTRCNIYLKIGDLLESENLDSAIYYYKKAILLIENEKIKSEINVILLKIKLYRQIGIAMSDNGNYELAIDYYNKSLKISEDIIKQFPENLDVLEGISFAYTNIGLACYDIGSYDKAIEKFLKSLKNSEKIDANFPDKIDGKRGITSSYNNIGNVHKSIGNYDEAIQYFYKSLEIIEDLKIKYPEEFEIKEWELACYNNIGVSYYFKSDYKQSLDYFIKAMKIIEERGDKKWMSYCYSNIGNVYSDMEDYTSAKIYFLKSLKILEEIRDLNGLATIYCNLALIQNTLAERNIDQNQNLSLSLEYGNKAMEIAKEINSAVLIYQAAGIIKNSYKMLGNYKKAIDYYDILVQTKDTIFNEEKSNSIADAEKKFQTEKKQLQIENLEKDNSLKNSEIQKQKILILSFVLGFIIILVFSIFLYRLFVQKKKANIQLAQKNIEVEQKNEEITTQRDEISAQRDLVTSQKEEIEHIHIELTDSINYAKRIQEAVLPISEEYRSIMGEHFILFRPKDIVSGDFYWTAKINNTLIVAVADCTGHGVPGAFMSMLGISFLNEIIRNKAITKANEVLNELRKEIINALQQKGHSGEQKDGMDMSLIAINAQDSSPKFQDSSLKSQISSYKVQGNDEYFDKLSTLQLNIRTIEHSNHELQTTNNKQSYHAQWAGANNPLWIVSCNETLTGFKTLSEFNKDASVNNELQTTTELASSTKLNNELLELKPDKMPIAIYEKMDSFTNHEFQLVSGDCIYLMSDGYQDQFGGPNGKKFLSKNLKQLLIANCHLPMENQKQILEKTLLGWIGDSEQIDDITILGLKI